MKHSLVVTRLETIGELHPRVLDEVIPPEILLSLDNGFEEITMLEVVHGYANQIHSKGGIGVDVGPFNNAIDPDDVPVANADMKVPFAKDESVLMRVFR